VGGGKGGKQTIGYKHHVGMHMVACHGPIDNISRLTFDERLGWEGAATGGTITVNKPSLFGGEKREGGVAGLVDVLMGGPAQTKNSYLLSKIGPNIPAYRGVVSLVFRGTSSSRSFYWGNNPYLKPVRMRGQRVFVRQDGLVQWYPEKAGIPVTILSSVAAQLINIEADVNGGTTNAAGIAAGVTIAGYLPDDIVTVDTYHAGPYVAFSPWGDPSPINPGDSGSSHTFRVSKDGSAVDVTSYTTGIHDGYAAARADWEADNPDGITLTGASSYTFFIFDDPIGDNSGGISLRAAPVVRADVYDMNPAHLIRECLTDPDWGMGYADEDVDDDTFVAAADTLYDEGMGMSLLWDKQIILESFISEIIRHIDAALYVSRSTGKFRLKLTRADYDPDDLITLDESNIDRIDNPTKPAFGELINSVSVKFWSNATGKSDSVTVQDPAGVQMQGTVINTMIQYPGFTNTPIASRVADRDLRALSNPFLTCTIYTSETQAADLDIGDCFKLTWGKWLLFEVVMRVTGFAMSDGKNSQVRLDCVEDVFSTPISSVLVPPAEEWVDPSGPPEPSATDDAFEIPYYELVQALGQTDTDTKLTVEPALGFVGAAAVRGNSVSIAANLWTDSGAGYVSVDAMDLCPGGFLSAAIGKKDTEITLAAGHQDLDVVTVGQHCQIGTGPEAELARVDAVDAETGEVTIGRGVLDTVPHDHAAATPVLFWDAYGGFDPTEYMTGETVLVKVTPTSGSDEVELVDAVEHEVDMAGRAYRPYPPGDLLVNGLSYDDEPLTGELTIEWVGRDRILQTSGELFDHFEAEIGPEAGTTYRVLGYIDDVLVHTEEPAVAPFLWTPPGEGVVRVEASSKRDGVYSWQAATHEFIYSATTVRRFEHGDIRYTETGDIRMTED
jgi:hypothetical protein